MKKVRKMSSKMVNKNKLNKMIDDVSLVPKKYQMDETYLLGDYIEHSKFGNGFVESLIGLDKIKIIFNLGEKILMHTTKI